MVVNNRKDGQDTIDLIMRNPKFRRCVYKILTGHDPEPVPSTSHPHNLFP
jgi:hypothetical protein